MQTAATIAAIVVMARGSSLRRDQLGLVAEMSDGVGLAVGFGLNYLLSLAMYPLVEWLFDGDAPVQDIVETADLAFTSSDRLLVGIGAVLLAPITEELVFRGALLAALRSRLRDNTALVVSAAIFSVWHFVLDTSAILAVPPLFVLGLVMARQVIKTGRLARAVFTHMGFNLATMIALFLTIS
jgi:membrane protease YdiL (CAAX protease family)